MLKYKVYPTLLNDFKKYTLNPNSETKSELLNKINRVHKYDLETLNRFKKGASFEDAVLKNIAHDFDQSKVYAARELLPKNKVNQKLIKFIHEETLFYGYADVVGESRVIDIKTTSNFKPDRYLDSFQNLYLYGLKDFGFKTMEYHIFDFHEIRTEIYHMEDINWKPYLEMINGFAEFLNTHRDLITDKKIFIEEPPNLFS